MVIKLILQSLGVSFRSVCASLTSTFEIPFYWGFCSSVHLVSILHHDWGSKCSNKSLNKQCFPPPLRLIILPVSQNGNVRLKVKKWLVKANTKSMTAGIGPLLTQPLCPVLQITSDPNGNCSRSYAFHSVLILVRLYIKTRLCSVKWQNSHRLTAGQDFTFLLVPGRSKGIQQHCTARQEHRKGWQNFCSIFVG